MPYAKMYLLLALVSAILYAVAASSLRAAAERGAKTLHTSLLVNIATTIGFLAFMPWHEGNVFPAVWWPALLTGVLIFLGQWLVVLALADGRASVATTALGSKVVLVALIAAYCFNRHLALNVWIAATLTTLGIIVLALGPTGGAKGIGRTVILSILAALSYALFDVLIQEWAPKLTFGRLAPCSFIIATLLTAPPILITDRQPPRYTRGGLFFVSLGVILMALQSVILIWAVGRFHDAPGLNVVYGSRGICSVLLVWLLGHHFSRQERLTSPGMIIQRFAGALLIAAAVLLVFWPF